MSLCDNISTLRSAMTRVEKYRRYRNEISNMKFETLTTKKEVSMQVSQLQKEGYSNKLNYEQVMNVHEVYVDEPLKVKKRQLLRLTKYEIFYLLLSCSIILILIAAILLVK